MSLVFLGRRPTTAFKKVVPIAVAAVCAWIVLDHVHDVDLELVANQIGEVSEMQWLAAILATAISFLAIGQYDAQFHRWLATGVTARRAMRSGASAIAIAQTLGFGLITGTLARWRALPEVSLPTALKITNYVSFSFMVGLGVVSLLVLALPGASTLGASWFSIFAVVAVLLAFGLTFAQPAWLPFPLPPLRLSMRLVALIFIDVLFSALAFWALLPSGLDIEFQTILAVFTLSLGAGLLSGSPGGVGPFELCLLTLLPIVPEPEMIATVLAFRIVYYALPASVAILILMRPGEARASSDVAKMANPHRVTRAEALFADPSGKDYLATSSGQFLHTAEASQMLVSLGDTTTGAHLAQGCLDSLEKQADARSLWPMLYKCSGRSAVAARRRGWRVVRVSDEAWVDPRTYSTTGVKLRQLRRKLKNADKAQVSVALATSLPLNEMDRVAIDWAARVGGERGFSMGRYSHTTVARQEVLLARHHGRLVAFATFHVTETEWALDLMRSTSDMPDGTMHALINHALLAAGENGATKVSLAAMPLAKPTTMLRPLAKLCGPGLRQFKLSFAPNVSPLYSAAPSSLVLLVAAPDLLLRIRYPDGIPPFRMSRTEPLELVPQAV